MGANPPEPVQTMDGTSPASPDHAQTLDSLLGIATPSADAEAFFGFRVGGLGFLVPIHTYCEVIERTQVNPLPNTQPWFKGLLNLRGNLIPAIDLHLLFGEVSADPKNRRLFGIDKGEKAVAVWIDGFPQVHGIPPQALAQAPALPTVLERHVTGAYSHQGQTWIMVEYAALFRALGAQIALW